ncbi:ribonuclease HIII [Pseudobacillus wudalianchiensis]|uniref:Ribonuclease HIII n=1 Tax=Pseudobacillus wudalianchiensis TaxID=1743143 RepID=A0A1B9B8C2_9BACI|nr:ribonuclease HIII [Bacillus wudalianchiensis]OCA92340.1 ribonuclease HIII [Bacillus wudalianchiensis]
MSHTVLNVSSTTLSKMKTYYNSQSTGKLPAGAVFAAKTSACAITGYRSGKVLFQGKDALLEAAKWHGESTKAAPVKKKKPVSAQLPSGFSEMSVIGSDEVGTGDYFGPITVVSAFVRKEQLHELQSIGVRDSKDLTDPQIIQIAKKIAKVVPYSLLVLKNEKYNELQQKGMSQGKIKALLHNQALINLHKKILPERPDAVLIDQFAEKDTYYRYLKEQKEIFQENVFFSTKGESIHLAVAAASIIARYAFVKQMDNLSSEAGFPIPKGAGSHVDVAAARLISEKGEEALLHFTKKHFANTQKALKLVNKR